MQPRTSVVLLVLALALGAFVYWVEIAGEAKREAADQQAHRIFPDVEAKDIEWLRLATEDGVDVEIEGDADGWRVVSPIPFPADKVNLAAMAWTLAGLESESTIDAAAARAVYGLGDDAYRVAFRAGAREHVLIVGKETPVGDDRYVAIGSDPDTIRIVPSWKTDALRRDFVSLRDRRIMSFDRERVTSVAVRWPRGEVVLERGEAGWRFSTPRGLSGEPADGVVVDALLVSLLRLQATGFDDSGKSDRSTGLNRPDLQVELVESPETGDDAGEPAIHRLAVTYDKIRRVGVIRSRHPATLYLIDRMVLSEYQRDVFAYRNKKIATFESREAQTGELIYTSGGESRHVRIERGELGWQAVDSPWRPGLATQLVALMTDLEATGVVAEAMGNEELAYYGLAPATLRVRILGKPAEAGGVPVLADVGLGRPGDVPALFAQAAGRDTVYRVDAGLVKDIPFSIERLEEDWLQPVEPEPEAADAAEGETAVN